jgi:hypothetical protein
MSLKMVAMLAGYWLLATEMAYAFMLLSYGCKVLGL